MIDYIYNTLNSTIKSTKIHIFNTELRELQIKQQELSLQLKDINNRILFLLSIKDKQKQIGLYYKYKIENGVGYFNVLKINEDMSYFGFGILDEENNYCIGDMTHNSLNLFEQIDYKEFDDAQIRVLNKMNHNM